MTTPAWRPAMLTAALGLLVAAGCGPGSSPVPTGPPTPGPSAAAGEIDHPTDRKTVILRLDEGGGFVPVSYAVTEAPAFSLYGDGTAIFRDPWATPPPAGDQIVRGIPYQVFRLAERDVQSLLAFAIGPGGLSVARDRYQLPVADAPTTVFTIVAGGLDRTVSVNGLGVGVDEGVDARVLNALASLRVRLMGFGASIVGETPWIPQHYRGIIMEPASGDDQPGEVLPWPWPTIQPADFAAWAYGAFPNLAVRVMSPAEIAALGLDHLEGGAQGILLSRPARGPGGPPYEFALRPLLPDETG